MLIAKLRVSVRDAGISYNSSQDLETDKSRGSVLEDGKVVRGLGTSFASQEAKDRYDRLVKESNELRDKFNRRFGRGPIESTFIISRLGEAKEFVAGLLRECSQEIDAFAMEWNLDSLTDPDERELREWSGRIKQQIKRVPLGRGKEVDDEGLAALLTLASCPVLAEATATRIKEMVEEVKIGKGNRADLKRNISLLEVEMDQSSLMATRSRPEPVA
jgi:hypothetical protein